MIEKDQSKRVDHAVGVDVEIGEDMVLFDNGIVGEGSKELTVENLVERMDTISSCYVIDLFLE